MLQALSRPLAAAVGLSLVLVAPAAAVGDDGTDEVQGTFVRLAVELRDGGHLELTGIDRPDGSWLRVDPATVEEVVGGSEVVATVEDASATPTAVLDEDAGTPVVSVDVVETPTLAAAAAEPTVATTTREVDVVVARMAGVDMAPASAASVAADVTDHVAPYWSDQTAGGIDLVVDEQVTAPTYTSWGSEWTCTDTQILALMGWAEQQVTDGTTPGHVVLETPIVLCPFLGVATVSDGGVVWLNAPDVDAGLPRLRPGTLAHEIGHNLLLGHSDLRGYCGLDGWSADGSADQCQEQEYGDLYDIMGAATGQMGSLSGAHLHTLGLAPEGSWVEATGTQTVTLEPVGGLTGQRFLELPGDGVTHVVELRTAVGRDAFVGTNPSATFGPGVVVRRIDPAGPGQHTALLVADVAAEQIELGTGDSFATEDGRWSVEVTSLGGTATLDVTHHAPAARPTGVTVTPTTTVEGQDWTSAQEPTVTWAADELEGNTGFEVVELASGLVVAAAGDARSADVALPEGEAYLAVRTVAANGAVRWSSLVPVQVDRTAPAFASAPEVRLRGGAVSTSWGVPVRLAWRATDAGLLTGAAVEGPGGDGLAPGASALGTTVTPGPSAWTVSVQDAVGGSAQASEQATLVARAESAAARTGTWTTVTDARHLDGRAMRSSKRLAATSYTFTGSSIGWIATKSANSGRVTVYVDGVKQGTVDLRASTSAFRQVVFTKTWPTAAKHTIRIVSQGTAGRPYVYSDGFAVLK